MLKKRILASSMASVMALSAVSVVAFADETATDFGEVVTKAELKEYVNGFNKFLEAEIYEYGTVQAGRFQDAYDHAKNVSESSKVEADDITAAYQMLKSVYDALVQKSAEDLKNLIAECKPTYDENNILNEDIGDIIYKEGVFATFKTAFEDAQSFVDSDDGRLITDAWFTLKEAYDALEKNKLDIIYKSDYRNVIRDYEAMISKFNKYEDWRRGTVSKKPTTGGALDAADEALDLTKSAYVTWGQLQNIVYGESNNDNIVSKVNKDAEEDDYLALVDGTWIAVSPTVGKKTVAQLVYEQSERFDLFKTTSKTTDTTIVGAYKAAKEAIDVFNSWKADSFDNAVKADVAKTVNSYRAKLARDFSTDLIQSVITAAGTYDDDDNDETAKVPKLVQDGTKLVAKAKFTLNLDKKTNLVSVTDEDAKMYNATPAEDDKSYYVINVAAGQDIMKYIVVKSANVTVGEGLPIATDPAGKVDVVADALGMVEAYEEQEAKESKDRNWDVAFESIEGLDQHGTVSKAGGSAREYTIINRFLNYALADLYPVEAKGHTHTRSEVRDLVAKAYDLIDLTGDSYVFAAENADLAAARKLAVEWLREADSCKTYKDNDSDASRSKFAYGIEMLNATEVYHKLSDAEGAKYDALKNKYAKYPISYGEIVAKIAAVSEDIEDGVYGKSSDIVKKALQAVAYGLSTLKVSDEGNEAFTYDRVLNAYNRLRVDKDANASEKALKAALDALDTAIEDASKEPEVVKGDIDGVPGITPADARAALELYLAGEYNEAADMDGNGIVNAKDARAILELWLQA